MAKKRCDQCRFWELEEMESGLCHRNPPVMLGSIVDGMPWSEFPRTAGGDWCGEFLPHKGAK